MDQSRRILSNSFFNSLPFAVELLIGVALVPLLVRHLGSAQYGVWALVASALAYSPLLLVGLNSGVNRWIPMHLVERDFDAINRVVATVAVAYAVSSGVLLVATGVLMVGFPVWFQVPEGAAIASQWAVLLVGLGFVCLIQLSVFTGVLSGYQRYDLMAAADLVAGLIQIIGIAAILVFDGGLVALAAVYAGANVARAVLGSIFALRECEGLRIRLSVASAALFREMFAYSFNSFLYGSQLVIQRQMSLVLIGIFLSATDVTSYAMPLLVANVVVRLVGQLTAVLKPAVSRLDALDDGESVVSVFVSSSKFTLMLAIPIAAFLVFYGERLLRVWLGTAFEPQQVPILTVLACASVFHVWSSASFFVVVGLGKHELFGWVTLAKALIASLTALVGLAVWDWGTQGVALAFGVPEAVTTAVILLPYCSRAVGVEVSALLRTSVRPALIATAPFVLVAFLARSTLLALPMLEFVVGGVALGGVALAGIWLFGLVPAEKRALRSAIGR